MKDVIIVTRHAGLVEVLREDFGIEGRVISHALGHDVIGRPVVGVLPLHLASLAESITEVVLDLPADKRGQELTAAEVRQFMKGLRTYVVQSVDEYNENMEEARLYGDYDPIPIPGIGGAA
jgi:hypothetical protein